MTNVRLADTDERQAWDLYAAHALEVFLVQAAELQGGLISMADTAETAAAAADALIIERRNR